MWAWGRHSCLPGRLESLPHDITATLLYANSSLITLPLLAIFIGRFSGPLRASVPIVAGVLGMPYRTFQLANFSSAFVWVAVLLELGDIGAAISTWLWNDVVGRFST